MQVKVEDDLSGIGVHVKNRAVAFFRDSHLRGDLLRGFEHVAQQRRIVCRDFVQGRNVLLRADQDVNGSLGMNVMKGNHPIVFGDDVGLQLVAGNAAE